MMNRTKLIVAVIAFAGFASSVMAQFEGNIEFKKFTLTDTTKYIYYVKGSKVRLDEISSKTNKPTGSFLIDLAASSMTGLNHDRKLTYDVKPGTPVTVGGNPVVSNPKVTKMLLGVSCKELDVTNKDENTTVRYYVGGTKFDFFLKFLNLMNRKDKQASYFLLVKEAGDGFPYLSIQTDNAGKEIGRLEVTKIDKKVIDPSVFVGPKDYQKFEKN